MEWTDEVIERLRTLWAEGHSTAEIGRRLGTTKNAVVGKAHRLKLPTRPSPIKSRRKKQENSDPSSQNELFGKAENKAAKETKTKTAPPVKAAEIVAEAEKPSAKPAMKQGSTKKETSPQAALNDKKLPKEEAALKISAKGGKSSMPAAKFTEKPSFEEDDFEEILEEDFAAEAERLKAKRKSQRSEKKEKLVPQVPKRLGLTCQWPFGDPGDADFHFCGEKIVPGRPYCLKHCEQAYVRKIVK